jgi:hypothetical protein
LALGAIVVLLVVPSYNNIRIDEPSRIYLAFVALAATVWFRTQLLFELLRLKRNDLILVVSVMVTGDAGVNTLSKVVFVEPDTAGNV